MMVQTFCLAASVWRHFVPLDESVDHLNLEQTTDASMGCFNFVTITLLT